MYQEKDYHGSRTITSLLIDFKAPVSLEASTIWPVALESLDSGQRTRDTWGTDEKQNLLQSCVCILKLDLLSSISFLLAHFPETASLFGSEVLLEIFYFLCL